MTKLILPNAEQAGRDPQGRPFYGLLADGNLLMGEEVSERPGSYATPPSQLFWKGLLKIMVASPGGQLAGVPLLLQFGIEKIPAAADKLLHFTYEVPESLRTVYRQFQMREQAAKSGIAVATAMPG